MGKIVKYCSSCDEGFAEKFSFCPNCANELSAYEMKPVSDSNGLKKAAEEEVDASAADTILSKSEEMKPETVSSSVAENSNDVEKIDGAKDSAVFEPVSFESDKDEEDIDGDDEIVTKFESSDDEEVSDGEEKSDEEVEDDEIVTEFKSSKNEEAPEDEIETKFASSSDEESPDEEIETRFEQTDNEESPEDEIETKFGKEEAIDGDDEDEVDTIIATPPAISQIEGLKADKKAAAASFVNDEPERNFDFYRHDLEDDYDVTVIQDQS
ncbi:MAG: hypothetical protein HKN25_01700, partial [Pyrinomonadaceae bacterium]|nr:hypothetical protein [Pyrinomonadaceae bacterium]